MGTQASPLTLEQAQSLHTGQRVYHMTLRNKSTGKARAYRVKSVKLWKTRPGSVRIGAQWGYYARSGYIYITEADLADWSLTEPVYGSQEVYNARK